MRQLVLDTETTGLETADDHRIIEIGCIELVNRRKTGRTFHYYLQPDRAIDAGAVEVHGITNEFLADKPRFADIVDDFLAFARDSQLVIHNAPFDLGFLEHELSRMGRRAEELREQTTVLDTLVLARDMHPGQRNSLDALCKRYEIDNSQREYHGALLDAEILADVYLAMTGGQVTLSLEGKGAQRGAEAIRVVQREGLTLAVVAPSEAEAEAHAELLDVIRKSAGDCLWDS